MKLRLHKDKEQEYYCIDKYWNFTDRDKILIANKNTIPLWLQY